MKKLRVGITGIAIESSTFSPHRSTVDDFRVLRGDDLLARYDFLDADWAAEVEWVPLVDARSLPGGAVTEEAYAELSGEILDRLRSAGELDGLFFDIHGAMSVVGRSDVEASLAREIRSILGPDVLVSASMDLHGNVSRELVTALDLITCYRMAPHEDAWETRERAARNLVSRLRSGGRPKKAWVQVPVLLPGRRPVPGSNRRRAFTPRWIPLKRWTESWTRRSGLVTRGRTNHVARPRS